LMKCTDEIVASDAEALKLAYS